MKLVSALWLCASLFAAIASAIWFASGHTVAGNCLGCRSSYGWNNGGSR